MSKSDKIIVTVVLVLGLAFGILLTIANFPIHLNDTRIELTYSKTFGRYKDLSLKNTHFDSINQKVIIETTFYNMEEINNDILINETKNFIKILRKYIIPKKIDAVWFVFTNPEGHSIGGMWTSRDYIKRVKWDELTNEEFKKTVNYSSH